MRGNFSNFSRKKDPRGDPDKAAAIGTLIQTQFVLHTLETDHAKIVKDAAEIASAESMTVSMCASNRSLRCRISPSQSAPDD